MKRLAIHVTVALAMGLGLALALLAGLHSVQAAPASANLFVKPTGSGSVCSQGAPCALQTALSQAVDGDTIYVAGGTYTGTGAAAITVTKSITLYGGWDGATTIPVVRNPAAYTTTLDGEGARRVVYISGDITPTLDGFIVARGNATGLLANCPTVQPDGCGGGVFVNAAHPIIANNIITRNVAAIATTGYPTGNIGYGGGIYLINADRAVISGNLVISNVASTAGDGNGGGIYLGGSATGVRVQSNRVISNQATTKTSRTGWGGGISGGPYGALIQGNLVEGNRTNPANTGYGAGLHQWQGAAQYTANLVRGNRGSHAIYLGYSQSRLEGNWVVDNDTGTGIHLVGGSGGGPTLVNNVIARSGSSTLVADAYAGAPLTATLLHNTLVGSGTGYGVYVEDSVTLYLTNTIVASHTWGITNTFPASSTVRADHALFYHNTSDYGSGVTSTAAISGNPAFVNPASGDYHLGSGSAAVDAGVNAGVTTDIDGDTRPIGGLPDIGADEAALRRVFLPLVLRNF